MHGCSTASAHKQQSKIAKPRRSFDLNHQRRRDIARLVVARHGKLAKAALCIPYAEAAAWHCPSDSERRVPMVKWCRWTCAPPSVERQIDAILKANPARRIRADTLARHLHVSDAERTDLRIWTIGAYDKPKTERIKRRKEKRRLADKARRQVRGAKPREQSLSRKRPWEAFGIKRRAWERRGKAKRILTTRPCVGCGKTFEPTRADAQYCSSACRQQAYRTALRITRRKYEAHRVTDNTTQIQGHDTLLPSGLEFASSQQGPQPYR
jgi:hypothetical protein